MGGPASVGGGAGGGAPRGGYSGGIGFGSKGIGITPLNNDYVQPLHHHHQHQQYQQQVGNGKHFSY